MTQVELEIKLIEYKGGKITLTEAMTAVEAYSSASNNGKPIVSGSLPSQELIEMLKECRDMLVMWTLIDKSGQCQELMDKVDAKTGWQ